MFSSNVMALSINEGEAPAVPRCQCIASGRG